MLDDHMRFHIVEVDALAPLAPRWRLLDVTHLSKLRPDAHPSEALHDAAVSEGEGGGAHWRLLDVTHLSKLRPDAHPSEALHDAAVSRPPSLPHLKRIPPSDALCLWTHPYTPPGEPSWRDGPIHEGWACGVPKPAPLPHHRLTT